MPPGDSSSSTDHPAPWQRPRLLAPLATDAERHPATAINTRAGSRSGTAAESKETGASKAAFRVARRNAFSSVASPSAVLGHLADATVHIGQATTALHAHVRRLPPRS
ncbi:hypothetical protein [Streptomyces sp. NRRL F-2580]|uniref:hypothetical protein n=1 Tax=Streptomyces sp. NRRL F-2580 TaxID=1463841 RepID=UPI00131BAC48|nr:hypothetical protein [Streptomyces sp. NRRL F-2580]